METGPRRAQAGKSTAPGWANWPAPQQARRPEIQRSWPTHRRPTSPPPTIRQHTTCTKPVAPKRLTRPNLSETRVYPEKSKPNVIGTPPKTQAVAQDWSSEWGVMGPLAALGQREGGSWVTVARLLRDCCAARGQSAGDSSAARGRFSAGQPVCLPASASATVSAVMLTIRRTVAEGVSTCTGLSAPSNTGPMAMPPPAAVFSRL